MVRSLHWYFARTLASHLAIVLAMMFATITVADRASAQDADTKDKPAQTDSDGDDKVAEEEEKEEVDPFAMPEKLTAENLLNYIDAVKRLRGRTLPSATKSAEAVVDGAAALRKVEGVSLEDETKAITEQLSALEFLARFQSMTKSDRDFEAELQALVDETLKDPREEIASIGKAKQFSLKIAGAAKASKEEQIALIDELTAMFADKPLDRQGYAIASSLARSIGASDNSDVAAGLYEKMADWMAGSDDEALQERADNMIGAARRMRLPGNFMELVGKNTEGEMFDWTAYRGKVVLVDFWASWCGPCRAEVPNMKRNLELYKDRGFAIVGINLDNTLEACNGYVEKEDLTWENIISDQEDEMGWNTPMARFYGIQGIPTAILVDEEGKVISMSARGKKLDELLAETLGPAETDKLEEDDKADDEGDESDS